ncbi:hypothetical protein ACQYZY_27190 [Pseudomonas aeruginosa]|jgi:hypothetical protein|uniref:hypothetical protein n=1 Tax=Pseudomonas aeruginosa TaxID=287 RepID=UPI001A330751|nr:hypothetical protein [Pseudomonas aeruginosa]EKV0397517.1 hypothetical protein [Pseudomonas aeruginosa]EKV3013119.1 hypothetical protein [Pseudomonas aeruginosa]MBH4318186.1 hypothetical protein [Pseudomonas aeruginosa]MBH8699593.1 hypothetical protein [Pseudomonas aeruginosa]WBM10742.1 hypothetical protein M1V28_32490 [Pseudomonas aeruginosa]
MFFLSNPKGAFLAGYVPAGDTTAILFEGQSGGGRTKIHKKFEERRETPEAAWDFLCSQVTEARADGYQDASYQSSTLKPPGDTFSDVFPLARRGIYARVESMTHEQFTAGLDRLNEVHANVEEAGVKVSVQDGGRWVRLSLGSVVIEYGYVPNALWETMSAKAQELSTEKRMMNGNFLLPEGKGLWHLQTQESVLDVYIRAFMAGAITAGAKIHFNSDHPWGFSEVTPFLNGDVTGLSWYQLNPGLLRKVRALEPQPEPIGGWDFYL